MSKKNKGVAEGAQTENSPRKLKGKQRQMDDDQLQGASVDVTAPVEDNEDEEDDMSIADEEGGSEGEDESKPFDLDKIRKRMHYAVRQMSQKAKQARKFELQRQIKRIKSCKDSSEKSALEAQLTSMKTLDLQNIAASALLSKLGKSKLIPRGGASTPYKTQEAQEERKGIDEWPVMIGVWDEEVLRAVWMATGTVEDDAGTEAAKAKAKLLSHKLLAEESARLTDILSRLAGRERVKASVKEEPSVAASAEREWSGSEDEGMDEEEALEADSESGDDEEDAELDEDAVRERIEQLGDLDQWDALVDAGSSGDEEEERASPPRDKKRKRSTSPRLPDKKQAVPSKGRSDESESDVESDKEDEEQQSSDSDASSSSSSSHYLPTLTHGYLSHTLRTKDDDFSGSESSDIDSDAEDTIQGKAKGSQKSTGTRKNRMGQRARKALWEKKYGRNANHVKLLLKEKKRNSSTTTPPRTEYKPLRRGRDGKPLPEFTAPATSDSGWKRFPVPPPAAPSQESLPKQRPSRPHPPHTFHAPPTKAAPAQNTSAQQQELHPSWVAKQKQKEKEEMVARALHGGGGAAGKKVVFD